MPEPPQHCTCWHYCSGGKEVCYRTFPHHEAYRPSPSFIAYLEKDKKAYEAGTFGCPLEKVGVGIGEMYLRFREDKAREAEEQESSYKEEEEEEGEEEVEEEQEKKGGYMTCRGKEHEAKLEYARLWRARNKEKVKEYSRRFRLKEDFKRRAAEWQRLYRRREREEREKGKGKENKVPGRGRNRMEVKRGKGREKEKVRRSERERKVRINSRILSPSPSPPSANEDDTVDTPKTNACTTPTLASTQSLHSILTSTRNTSKAGTLESIKEQSNKEKHVHWADLQNPSLRSL
ncbi:hypothetical protein BDQ17DRAFT_1366946 [Cyathus striatus]|nr:hypothetical protein BDQ17DRAFT_1366946 [Cyathus striatus]